MVQGDGQGPQGGEVGARGRVGDALEQPRWPAEGLGALGGSLVSHGMNRTSRRDGQGNSRGNARKQLPRECSH